MGKESRSETGLWDAVPDWNGRVKCGSPASRYCERGSKFCGSRRSRVAHFAMPGRFIMAFCQSAASAATLFAAVRYCVGRLGARGKHQHTCERILQFGHGAAYARMGSVNAEMRTCFAAVLARNI